MDFEPTSDQRDLIDGLGAVLARFDDAYWLARDRDGRFPEEFVAAMAEGGWLGIALPEAHGGAGLGVTEAALMMLEVARTGGMSAASAIHMNVFGPQTIVKHGTPEQQARWLPGIVAGQTRMCFSVTEPNTGLDTTNLKTRAVRRGGAYVVNGRKIWCSTAQTARKIMLLARTADPDPASPSAGLSLFFTDLDRSAVEVRAIDKMGRAAVDSNELFIDDFRIPAGDLIGEEGKGFRYILNSLNPERILIAAEAVGIGFSALDRATRYAKEREVFGRPIGQNQAIQHPLAEAFARLHAARLMLLRAATLYDSGQPCGVEANAAKWLAAETGLDVCRQAVATHGGMGYAREFHVERLFREVMIPYLAPVSQQLALCYVAERGLGLPKSY
ncbi:MAG TPA: acyl-CoA dehydrogenase family protein [Paracoccaceae bacterium]|nr:acyl-CoA dehydrogenase family protein [Paracoccaceae bacterium]